MVFGEEQHIFHDSQLVYPRNKILAEEFSLLPPSQRTFEETFLLVQHGLPLMKSMYSPAMTYLIEQGSLFPQKVQQGEGFEVVYASVVLNKGYGPWAAVVDPVVMREGQFQAYMVDNASRYVTAQMEQSGMTQEQVMERYKLSSEEFKELYAYCLASLADFPIGLYYSNEAYEEKLRFIKFDIGLPVLNLQDIQAIYYKEGSSDENIDISTLVQAIQQQHIPFEIFQAVGNEVFSAEFELTNAIHRNFKIPKKYKNPMQWIA